MGKGKERRGGDGRRGGEEGRGGDRRVKERKGKRKRKERIEKYIYTCSLYSCVSWTYDPNQWKASLKWSS